MANFYTMITKLVSFFKMFYLMKKLNELLFIRFFSLWGQNREILDSIDN